MTDHVIRGEYVVVRAAWSGDWAKAIGESLYLAATTGKKPGVLLVNTATREHSSQALIACRYAGIRLWTASVK